MGDQFERNVAVLKRTQPKLASSLSCVIRSMKTSDAPDDILINAPEKRSRCGDHSWKRSYGEPVLYLLGLHPFEEVASCLRQLPSHVRFIVILEPDQSLLTSFLDAVPVFDMLSSKRCVFAVSEETELLDEAVHAAFAREGFLVGRCAASICYASGKSGDQAYESLSIAFERALSFQIENLGNSPEDSLLGLRQMALSSPWTLFANKLSALKGRFENWPAVVVSAGPSLDINLHLLKGRENEVIIIAVDTVLEKLLKNAIVPHFVTALERGAAVYDSHFRTVLDENSSELKRVILVVQSVCVPRIAGRWPGPVIVVGKRDIVLDREVVGGLLGGGIIASGSSVAHMGLGLAYVLGSPAAALIGQDLAFAADGRSHARQTYWENDSFDMRTTPGDRLRVPALKGGTVETTRIWRYFIDQFTRMVSEIPIHVYDCTEGGALIPGTIVRALSVFLDDIVSNNAHAESTTSILKRILDDPASRGTDLEAFDRRYGALQRSFQRAKALIGRGLDVLSLLEAPVLTGERKNALIHEVRDILNDLTASSSILTYIGQAQFASLIAENYRLTDLSDRPILMQWIGRHRSFLENQATAVSMIIGWFLYIDGVRQLSETVIELLAVDDPVRRLCDAFVDGGRETFRGAIMIDLLLSRVEPGSSGFTETALLSIAHHYMREKRFEEAARVFAVISKKNVEESNCKNILFQWSDCYILGDLCWRPDYSKLQSILFDVYCLESDNDKLTLLCKQFLEKQRKDIDMILRLHSRTMQSYDSKKMIARKDNIQKLLNNFSRNAKKAKIDFFASFIRSTKLEGAE